MGFQQGHDFQEMLDFPPAPKLDLFGKLDPAKATPAEMRGQQIFFGKGQCASCHQPPYYTDNLMHDLKTERFFKPEMVNYAMEVGDGKIKTFPLRDGQCDARVVRGGAFNSYPGYARAAARIGAPSPAHDVTLGFRVAKTIAP